MSITVRLWSNEELEKAKSDDWLATLLMNKAMFNKEELMAWNRLPQKQRKFELYWFMGGGQEDRAEVFAPNIKMLRKYIVAQFNEYPDEIIETITKYNKIEL